MVTARTQREVTEEVAARVLARSELKDMAPGTTAAALVLSVAEEVAGAEQKMVGIRRNFVIHDKLEGRALRERVRELPGGGVQPLEAAPATGQAVTLERENTSSSFTLRAGAVLTRSDNPQTSYTTTHDVLFLPGKSTATAHITCTTAGEEGNCVAGSIDALDTAPAEIVGVVQHLDLFNGINEETDAQLRARARLYLRSLARGQREALEYIARTYQTPDGQRARFVYVYEDPNRPGYTELLIDDGSGTLGATSPGEPLSGVIRASENLVLAHQAPATDEISVEIERAGESFNLVPEQMTTVPERGLIYPNDGVLQPDDTWTIKNYRVYTGLIAGLQSVIEGEGSTPGAEAGWRGSGLRVRVLPIPAEWVGLSVRITPNTRDYDADALTRLVQESCARFFQTLAPGQELYKAQLSAHLLGLAEVEDVALYRPNNRDPLTNFSPANVRRSLRVRSADVRVEIVYSA